MPPAAPEAGETFVYRRTFSNEEVLEFAALTRDRQAIHTEPDEQGRLVVQGLLTGSLMTKIGSDLEYVAAEMTYEFRRPVHTGEEITCRWTVESRSEEPDRYWLDNAVVYRNESGDVVVEAATSGIVRK